MKYKQRESWKSRLGFILAALGSAVGLGSIWRFPYIVGENGGAIFILVYIFCLIIIGFPVLVAEILIGRTAQSSPYGSFRVLGRNKYWGGAGSLAVITGFINSSFYSVVAGWSLGYFIEALRGNLSHFAKANEATLYFQSLNSSSFWTVGFHFLFLLISLAVIFLGVRKGIEAGNKIMMPLLIIVLIFLVIKGLAMSGAYKSFKFLFYPNWHDINSKMILIALGQAFFSLSLGQGTMITYGSYLSRNEDIPRSCFPVVLLNTIIALMIGFAVFSVVFTVDMQPSAGTALVFETLPIVFSQISGGYQLSILFFFLITVAALTSEISALEPVISYFIDEKGYSRKKASFITVSGAFILGIPCALSFGLIKGFTIFNMNFFEMLSTFAVNILVPLGGFFAVILVAWRWGIKEAFENLKVSHLSYFHKRPILYSYFFFCLKYASPILIILILLNIIGIY